MLPTPQLTVSIVDDDVSRVSFASLLDPEFTSPDGSGVGQTLSFAVREEGSEEDYGPSSHPYTVWLQSEPSADVTISVYRGEEATSSTAPDSNDRGTRFQADTCPFSRDHDLSPCTASVCRGYDANGEPYVPLFARDAHAPDEPCLGGAGECYGVDRDGNAVDVGVCLMYGSDYGPCAKKEGCLDVVRDYCVGADAFTAPHSPEDPGCSLVAYDPSTGRHAAQDWQGVVTRDAYATPDQLVFTRSNWMEPQTVTVHSMSDQLDEHNETFTFTHGLTTDDPKYLALQSASGLATIEATVLDNPDTEAGIVAHDIGEGMVFTTEGDATLTYRLEMLSEPLEPVTVAIEPTGGPCVGLDFLATGSLAPPSWHSNRRDLHFHPQFPRSRTVTWRGGSFTSVVILD